MFGTNTFINSSIYLWAMKCEICKKNIEENFLKKMLGTYIKDDKGKKHVVCDKCQRKFQSKEEILKNL